MFEFNRVRPTNRKPCNKGRLIGPKPPLKQREIWAIRSRLQINNKTRDLAMFNLAIDSKLRGCDLMALKVGDVCNGEEIRSRTTIRQRKTNRPVTFELTDQTRDALRDWINKIESALSSPLFPSSVDRAKPLSTRMYARLVNNWTQSIGLDPKLYGTHSLRRTKASIIYKKTGNLRAVQILLGHSKIESTVRYLGIDVEDALEISEQVEI